MNNAAAKFKQLSVSEAELDTYIHWKGKERENEKANLPLELEESGPWRDRPVRACRERSRTRRARILSKDLPSLWQLLPCRNGSRSSSAESHRWNHRWGNPKSLNSPLALREKSKRKTRIEKPKPWSVRSSTHLSVGFCNSNAISKGPVRLRGKCEWKRRVFTESVI